MRPLQEEYRAVKHAHKQGKEKKKHPERREDIGSKNDKNKKRLYSVIKMILKITLVTKISLKCKVFLYDC